MSYSDEEVTSETIEKDEDNVKTKRKIIYELGADSTLEFGGGKVIKVNKTLLALESEYFHDIFFGASPVTEVKVNEFDRETFQIFLDCLFGIKEYSVLDVLLIFPIAHKYKVKKCLAKCISVLIPKKMDEDVCLSLNLAVFYKCNALVNSIIAFCETNVGVIALLENKNYSQLLEPMAVIKLMEHINLDFSAWKLIYEWGIDYLKNRLSGKDIHAFFSENGILQKLLLDQFESIENILSFHKMTDNMLLDPSDIVNYVDINLGKINKEKMKMNFEETQENVLVSVKSGERIIETIVIDHSVLEKNNSAGLLMSKPVLNLDINHIYVDLSTIEGGNYFDGYVDCALVVYPKNSTPNTGKPVESYIIPIGSFDRFGSRWNTKLTPVSTTQFADVFITKRKIEFRFKSEHSLSTDLPCRITEIDCVQIYFLFKFDCVVLKSCINSENVINNVPEKLYLTKDVSVVPPGCFHQKKTILNIS